MTTMMTSPPKPRIHPSAWWYLLVPLLLAVGVSISVQRGIDEVRAVTSSFEKLGADGIGSIELDRGDEATVWAIWEDSRTTGSLKRPSVEVTVTGPGGANLKFDERTGAGTTFSFGSLSGIDLGTFTAPRDGDYRVQVEATAVAAVAQELEGAFGSAAPGLSNPPPLAAVGSIDLSGAFGRVVMPAAMGFFAAITAWFVIAVMRGRSKRRGRRETQTSLGILGAPAYAQPTAPSGTPPKQPDPQGPINFS